MVMENHVTEQRPTNALMTALLAARKRVPARVHKAGRNESQKYADAGHEHVLVGGARDALLEHDLVLLLESYEMVGADSYKTAGGDKQCWRWRGRFLLLHTSGEQLSLSYEATTVPNDKASFVASTALDRTAHMRVLELAGSDEENPEHDSNEAPAAKARSSKAKAKEADPPRPAAWWRDQHNSLCDLAFKKASIASGPADDFGLHIPTLPVPHFSNESKNYPGLPYNHANVKRGFLRDVIWKDKDFAKHPAAVKLWVSFLVAKHEIGKLEAEAAEKALALAGGAA
jgi:hypothetical protein